MLESKIIDLMFYKKQEVWIIVYDYVIKEVLMDFGSGHVKEI